jgi:hypothetical protein
MADSTSQGTALICSRYYILQARPGNFDSSLVEAGPSPMVRRTCSAHTIKVVGRIIISCLFVALVD